MGLSSSQARLLHLTGRMHQIEYKAAKLEAEKLQMANESRRVYLDYENALDATKIQRATLNTDGTINYVDATYFNMKEAGYDLRFDGKVVLDDATAANYVTASDNKNYFIALQTGRVTEDNRNVDGIVEVYTADQLMKIRYVNNIRLMSDIDMTGKNWNSKALASGKTFDGNGHSIKGLNKALFNSVSGTVKNVNIQGDVNSRGIVANNAYNNATFENITVSGSLNYNDWNAGALIGYASGDNVTVSNCSANVDVVSTSGNVGALIGATTGNSTKITNCSSTGSIQGDNTVGGLIGHANNATVSNCSSSASVYATKAGHGQFQADDCAGGLIGTVKNSNISNCEARGNVKGEASVLGGFIGSAYNSTVSNSNAYGNVSANINNVYTDKKNAAGFISALAGVDVMNCNAYGASSSNGTSNSNGTGEATPAGFVSSNMNYPSSETDNITNCYSADTTNPFVADPSSIDSIIQSSTPISNSISVSAPQISVTTTVPDPNGDGDLFDNIKENGYILESDIEGLTSKNGNDTKWFTNMVNEGYLFIYDKDKTSGEYYETSVSTNTGLQEVADETGLRKAEAKYEADMKRIDNKDKKYDYDLAALDNERNAIKQEMETLKTVAKDNVDRTFRLFS